MTKILKVLLLFGFILLAISLPSKLAQAKEIKDTVVNAPTIINSQGQVQFINSPLIIGLTQKNTEVLVYIDGVLAGEAKVQSQGTATDNFFFQSQ